MRFLIIHDLETGTTIPLQKGGVYILDFDLLSPEDKEKIGSQGSLDRSSAESAGHILSTNNMTNLFFGGNE